VGFGRPSGRRCTAQHPGGWMLVGFACWLAGTGMDQGQIPTRWTFCGLNLDVCSHDLGAVAGSRQRAASGGEKSGEGGRGQAAVTDTAEDRDDEGGNVTRLLLECYFRIVLLTCQPCPRKQFSRQQNTVDFSMWSGGW